MTLVSQAIIDAYREGNLIAVESEPSAAQQDEALRLLNRIVSGVYGAEAGEELRPVSLSSIDGGDVSPNTHLFLNVSAPGTLKLPANPDDGCRFAITDVGQSLATYPLTLDGNGRRIEGSLTLEVNTTYDREFFYRADCGSWEEVELLSFADELPFPGKFDDYFIIALAIRLNPRYGQQLDPQTAATYQRLQRQLRTRYRQFTQVASELGLLKLSGSQQLLNNDIEDDTVYPYI